MIVGRQALVTCSATLLTVAVLTAPLAAPAHATIIDFNLDPSQFGKLDQAKTNCPAVNCGPTAAVNSFVYLQNAFPNTYKAPLVPAGKAVDVANALNGKDFMNTCCTAGGTAVEDFILGKMAYLEQQDKGVTTYAAQMSAAWDPLGHPGVPKPSSVTDNMKPTVGFIAEELKAREDVEVALKPLVGPGHYLTLTGITFDTDTGKGTISFVDPNGGKAGTAAIMQGPGDNVSIVTDYMIDSQVTRIVGAVAESPVPEPSTVLLLGTALAGVGGVSWRRYRRRSSATRGHCECGGESG